MATALRIFVGFLVAALLLVSLLLTAKGFGGMDDRGYNQFQNDNATGQTANTLWNLKHDLSMWGSLLAGLLFAVLAVLVLILMQLRRRGR